MEIKKGFTLVEVVVVVGLFAVVGIITTQSLVRILGNTSNSNSTARARENVEHALSTIERSIRNANSISCPVGTPNRVNYVSQTNADEYIACNSLGGQTSIIQNGAPLTSSEINLTACSLVCVPAGSDPPNGVEIVLEASDNEAAYDSAPVRLQTTIFLRSY